MTVLQAPPFTAEAERWLKSRATGEERARTLDVLASLGDRQGPPKDQGPVGKKAISPRHATTVELGKPEEGWTYATTRGALRRGDSVAAKAATKYAEGRKDRREKDMEEALAALNAQHHRPHSAPITHQRELQNLMASTAKRTAGRKEMMSRKDMGAGLAQQLPMDRQGKQGVSPVATTYHMSYHLRDDYPELFDKAAQAAKAKPSSNKTMNSDWGDSLMAKDDREWRALNYKSNKTMTDAEVHPHRTVSDDTKEHAFYRWMARQKLYYNDLLKDSAKPELEALMSTAPLERKREALQVLRQLTAVVQPEMYKSHSQAQHCAMGKTEDPELAHMTHERTRRMTMGAPMPRPDAIHTLDARMSALRGEGQQGEGQGGEGQGGERQQRPWTTMAARQAGGGGGDAGRARPVTAGVPGGKIPGGVVPLTRTRRPAGASKSLKDTFKSQIPMKWAVGGGDTLSSAYIDAYGSPGVGMGAVHARREPGHTAKAGSREAALREMTCPIGAVNAHTAIAPAHELYPVPECFVKPKEFPAGPGDCTMATHYRDSYQPRSTELMLKIVNGAADANEKSRAALLKSALPLGQGGMCTLSSKDWRTEHADQFCAPPGIRGQLASDLTAAARLKQIVGGPTASAGRLTASSAHNIRRSLPATPAAVQ